MRLFLAIPEYSTLIVDYDGVVQGSDKVKTDALYRATLSYGGTAALALVEHHVTNGAITRYEKIAHFLEQVVLGEPGPKLGELLESYVIDTREGLLSFSIAPGLEALRRHTLSPFSEGFS